MNRGHEFIESAAGIDRDGHPPPEPPSAESDPWLELVEDGADICVKKLPSLVEIVQGVVCEQSKLLICGGSKSFKTWLMMHLTLCISHGLEWWDRATTRRPILYVNLELKRLTFDRRLQTLAQAMGSFAVERCSFLHLPLRGKLAGACIDDIVSRLIIFARHFKAGVVAIDPLYKLNLVGEENNARDQTLLFNQLDRITTEGECTLLINDHAGKGNQSEKDDPLDVIRGSSAKGGDIDTGLVLRKHEVKDCFRVDLVHRELAPVKPFVIQWQFPFFVERPDLDAERMRKQKAGRKSTLDPVNLLGAILNTSKEQPISISAWAAMTNTPRQTLTDHLAEFRSKNWIATVGEGNNTRQYITEVGREFIHLREEKA
jgi:hypothetical protein